MLQLLNLDPSDARAFKAFRIQVKERLYRFNYVSCPSTYRAFRFITLPLQEMLAQLEKQERLDKLEETFQNVIEGYRGILAMIHWLDFQ